MWASIVFFLLHCLVILCNHIIFLLDKVQPYVNMMLKGWLFAKYIQFGPLTKCTGHPYLLVVNVINDNSASTIMITWRDDWKSLYSWEVLFYGSLGLQLQVYGAFDLYSSYDGYWREPWDWTSTWWDNIQIISVKICSSCWRKWI